MKIYATTRECGRAFAALCRERPEGIADSFVGGVRRSVACSAMVGAAVSETALLPVNLLAGTSAERAKSERGLAGLLADFSKLALTKTGAALGVSVGLLTSLPARLAGADVSGWQEKCRSAGTLLGAAIGWLPYALVEGAAGACVFLADLAVRTVALFVLLVTWKAHLIFGVLDVLLAPLTAPRRPDDKYPAPQLPDYDYAARQRPGYAYA